MSTSLQTRFPGVYKGIRNSTQLLKMNSETTWGRGTHFTVLISLARKAKSDAN